MGLESYKYSFMCTQVEQYSSDMGQIKILASDKVLEDFKMIVLAKHGKLELSVEGEEALKMYIKKYDYLLKSCFPLKMIL